MHIKCLLYTYVIYIFIQSRNPKNPWRRAQESCLVGYLVDLVNAGGWRVDNMTFQPGYLSQLLVRMLVERTLGCRVMSITVIKSKIKLLKSTFPSPEKMQGPACSGFGLNNEVNCIIVEQDVFDSWVRVRCNMDFMFTTLYQNTNDFYFIFFNRQTFFALRRVVVCIPERSCDKSMCGDLRGNWV